MCLSWDETRARFSDWDVVPVRTLWRGQYTASALDEVAAGFDFDRMEGWVMRLASEFAAADFQSAVVKWVRRGHVQPDAQHWSKGPVRQNGLIKA